MTHETRLRHANDAVLTEMARSLLRGDRSAEDASAGRSTAVQAECVRHAARRFRRGPAWSAGPTRAGDPATRPGGRTRAVTLSS